MKTQKRFKDTGTSIFDFKNILVVCPNCSLGAELIDKHIGAPNRIICRHCGFISVIGRHKNLKQWYRLHYFERSIYTNTHIELWLQTNCCGHRLWAYNIDHLNFLESYVSAEIREHTKDEKNHWHNNSLASRLPKWIQFGKNRTEILKGIQKLRKKYTEHQK